MQFLIKWEMDLEIGGDRAPISCDARLGVAFDDQPTACLFGRSAPVRYLESGHTDTESMGRSTIIAENAGCFEEGGRYANPIGQTWV